MSEDDLLIKKADKILAFSASKKIERLITMMTLTLFGGKFDSMKYALEQALPVIKQNEDLKEYRKPCEKMLATLRNGIHNGKNLSGMCSVPYISLPSEEYAACADFALQNTIKIFEAANQHDMAEIYKAMRRTLPKNLRG